MTLRMHIESSQERRIADNKQIFQHRTVADGVLSQLTTGYFFASMGYVFLFYSASEGEFRYFTIEHTETK